MRGLVLLAIAGVATSCRVEQDPRIATPQATVETLLQATHLWGLDAPPVDPLGRGEESGGLPPPDLDLLALCFLDIDRDDARSRALAEFVAGMLAAGQRTLQYEVHEDEAFVFTGARRVYMVRARDGWHVLLRRSVPAEIYGILGERAGREAEEEERP